MTTKQGRILVIRGGAIGDFILTLPAITALRRQFPRAHLEILGYPHIAQLALLGGLVDRVQAIEARGLAGFFVFVLMVISELGVGTPAARCGGEAWSSRFPATPRGVCQQPATRSISVSTSWTIELVAAARPSRSVP